MFALFEARLRAGLTRVGRTIAGAICMVVAAIFFTIAGWTALVEAQGAVIAALIVGGIYLVLALLLIYLPVRPRVRAAPLMGAAPATSLVEAFLAGRAAGQAMRKD
ncbi:hypothetical protein [Salipiger mangrovisoli]|uniref:Holin-X, holin superfamily III n=1 Tax=Salipiger mangrovisoli TaxID=2865933 RepID=A0ABR9WV99_9RHOB|nr:hypothetical protein [Salipiger mangrovisoli]MBE9635225.1 hypothetical protein [Salipiger mangrovisoli]